MIKLSSTTGGSSGIENPPESLLSVFWVCRVICKTSSQTMPPLLFFISIAKSIVPSYP